MIAIEPGPDYSDGLLRNVIPPPPAFTGSVNYTDGPFVAAAGTPFAAAITPQAVHDPEPDLRPPGRPSGNRSIPRSSQAARASPHTDLLVLDPPRRQDPHGHPGRRADHRRPGPRRQPRGVHQLGALHHGRRAATSRPRPTPSPPPPTPARPTNSSSSSTARTTTSTATSTRLGTASTTTTTSTRIPSRSSPSGGTDRRPDVQRHRRAPISPPVTPTASSTTPANSAPASGSRKTSRTPRRAPTSPRPHRRRRQQSRHRRGLRRSTAAPCPRPAPASYPCPPASSST